MILFFNEELKALKRKVSRPFKNPFKIVESDQTIFCEIEAKRTSEDLFTMAKNGNKEAEKEIESQHIQRDFMIWKHFQNYDHTRIEKSSNRLEYGAQPQKRIDPHTQHIQPHTQRRKRILCDRRNDARRLQKV